MPVVEWGNPELSSHLVRLRQSSPLQRVASQWPGSTLCPFGKRGELGDHFDSGFQNADK